MQLFCLKSKQTLYSWQHEATPISHQGESDSNFRIWQTELDSKNIKLVNHCIVIQALWFYLLEISYCFDFKATEILVSNHYFSVTFKIHPNISKKAIVKNVFNHFHQV